jgi:PAS domain S-box-containing protein
MSPQAVFLLDDAGRILAANAAAAAAREVDAPDTLIGTDYFEPLAGNIAAKRRTRMEAVLNATTDVGRSRAAERIPATDGGSRLVRCTIAAVDGPAPAVVAVFEDEEVSPEAAPGNRRSENRFRNAFDRAPQGMALLDTEGRWRRVNRALLDMLGHPESDLIGRSLLSVTHVEDWARDIAWLDAALAGDTTPFDAEKRFLRADGTVIWAHVTRVMTRDPDGTPREIIGQFIDTSRRHEVEAALRASESRFREAFEAAPHGMAMCGLDGRFIEVNTTLCRILHRNEATLTSLDVTAVAHPEDHNVYLEAARRLLADDVRVFAGEMRFVRPDGTDLRGHVSVALARDGHGRPHHLIMHLQDITRQVEAEVRLHEAVATAEQALLAKTRFLAAASHDLRQPLQALNLFVSVLSGRETDPAKKDILAKVERSLEGLADLMNTLLDISKLEGGAILPDQRSFDLHPMIRRLAEEFTPMAADVGLTLRVVPPTATVFSDPALLEIILRNLIGNALKYTRRGGRVLLGARRLEGGQRLRLDIIDTGEGIPADQRQLIFEDFHRVMPEPGAESRSGLGLGLGIVNRVARLLGATVAVDSTVGRGSRFSVTVPCQVPGAVPESGKEDPARHARSTLQEAGAHATAADRAGRGLLHLVVVDDEAPVRESLTLLLEGWGHRVSAFAGLSDLTEALLTDALTCPDVMLADFRLPSGRTGVEAVALARGHFRRAVPALLLTGDTESQRLRDASRGGLPVLRKPVRPDQLRLKLAEMIGALHRSDGAATPNGEQRP